MVLRVSRRVNGGFVVISLVYWVAVALKQPSG